MSCHHYIYCIFIPSTNITYTINTTNITNSTNNITQQFVFVENNNIDIINNYNIIHNGKYYNKHKKLGVSDNVFSTVYMLGSSATFLINEY